MTVKIFIGETKMFNTKEIQYLIRQLNEVRGCLEENLLVSEEDSEGIEIALEKVKNLVEYIESK